MAAQDDMGIVAQMIEWLGIEGDEAANFMDAVMEKRGHKKAHSWIDNTEGDANKDKKPSNVFGLTPRSDKSKSGPSFQYGS